jgi:hypothetical protein
VSEEEEEEGERSWCVGKIWEEATKSTEFWFSWSLESEQLQLQYCCVCSSLTSFDDNWQNSLFGEIDSEALCSFGVVPSLIAMPASPLLHFLLLEVLLRVKRFFFDLSSFSPFLVTHVSGDDE